MSEKHSASETANVRKFARALLRCQQGVFTFLYHEGVVPTNNSAERGVRPGVMWRRICGGHETEKGAGITERPLVIAQTCRMQGIDPVEFLAEAILAYRKGLQAPLLLPEETSQLKVAAWPPEQIPQSEQEEGLLCVSFLARDRAKSCFSERSPVRETVGCPHNAGLQPCPARPGAGLW